MSNALTLQAEELLEERSHDADARASSPKPMTNPPHPSFVFTKEQIIGEIAYSESVQDGEGSEIGAMTGLESGADRFFAFNFDVLAHNSDSEGLRT